MLAVDTNVVVRFITADDPVQSPRARDLILHNHVWIGLTVLLETEWVLRSVHRATADDFCRAVRPLFGLETVEVENAAAVEQALAWHAAGAEFADALHWAVAPGCDAFVTFDKPLIATAARLGLPVREP